LSNFYWCLVLFLSAAKLFLYFVILFSIHARWYVWIIFGLYVAGKSAKFYRDNY
jgi:hypothetical protein